MQSAHSLERADDTATAPSPRPEDAGLPSDFWPIQHRFVVGVDLGQTADPTVAAVVKRYVRTRFSNIQGKEIRDEWYGVRHLEALPLGLSYLDQAARLKRLMEAEPLVGNADLVIDRTGVGRPVFDIFEDMGLSPWGVTITAGRTEKADGGDSWHVPKTELVGALEAKLHSGELMIPESLPEAQALKEELQDFQVRYTEATGHARFAAREGRHDDRVLALAIAVWFAARQQGLSGPQRIKGMF